MSSRAITGALFVGILGNGLRALSRAEETEFRGPSFLQDPQVSHLRKIL